MYTKNTFGRRRQSGWVERRRRYFQRLFASLLVTAPKGEEKRTVVLVGKKD